jgi:hypothetical protein
MNQELLDAVASLRSQNLPPAVIRVNLHIMKKWTDAEIDQALGTTSNVVPPLVTSAPSIPINPMDPLTVTPARVPEPVPLSTVPTPAPATAIPQTFVPQTANVSISKSSNGLKTALIALVVLLLVGGGYFAYSHYGVGSSYNESNLLSGLAEKFSKIDSATYSLTLSAHVDPRDKDATPEPSTGTDTSFSIYSFIPPELKIDGALSINTNSINKEISDWKGNLSGEGDLGDLTYKINIDFVQKDGEIFSRINNFPNIPFLGTGFTALKDKWITLGSSTESIGLFGSNSAVGKDKSYKESHDEVLAFLKRAAEISDSNRLFEINGSKTVTLNGVKLTRYEVKLRKEAIPVVYEQLKSEYGQSLNSSISAYFNDPGTSEYFKSQAFDTWFSNYEKNAKLFLYTDNSGNPAVVEYSLRIVPPDAATNLKDKQLNLVVRILISDINKPVTIEKPEGAKSIDELMKDALPGDALSELSEARSKGSDARVKANLSGLRASAEIFFDNNNSYGVTTSSCSSGMFVDASSGMRNYIDLANYPSGTKITCHSSGLSYAVSATLGSGTYWCVDNSGVSKEENLPLVNGVYSCK